MRCFITTGLGLPVPRLHPSDPYPNGHGRRDVCRWPFGQSWGGPAVLAVGGISGLCISPTAFASLRKTTHVSGSSRQAGRTRRLSHQHPLLKEKNTNEQTTCHATLSTSSHRRARRTALEVFKGARGAGGDTWLEVETQRRTEGFSQPCIVEGAGWGELSLRAMTQPCWL